MNTIVVPVNFSSCAKNAARYACDLAGAIGAELHLIHVIEVPGSTAEMMMTDSIYAQMSDSAQGSLMALKAEMEERSGGSIAVNVHLETGFVARRVKSLCSDLAPFAIVVGTAGPSLEKFFGGSPVSSLLHLLHPVIVVPEGVAFNKPRHIMLACAPEDIESGLPNALPLIKRLQEQFSPAFNIVSVANWPVSGPDESSLQAAADRTGLKSLSAQVHLLPKTDVEAGLTHFLVDHPADLVIVFPKDHSFLSFHVSQARKFANYSPVPVMSLHE